MLQALLAQFMTLPVNAGSDMALKQMLEAHMMAYTSSAMRLRCLTVLTSHTNGNVIFSWLYGQ